MAIYYDDSTIWDYTLQDITAILLTFLPYTMLLLITAKLFLKYKDKIFESLEKIYDYKNNEKIIDFFPKLNSNQQAEQELIKKLLETVKNEDLKLMEIQELISRTNDKLQSFSQRLDSFQDLKDTCSSKYEGLISTFNDFSNDVMNKVEKIGQKYQEHDDLNNLTTDDSVQDPMTRDAVQDVIRVDSEITGPDENKLKKNSNHRSRIPVFNFKKM